MTASVAMTNYFHELRQREDFGSSFEIVVDNPRTFKSNTIAAPEQQEEDASKKRVSKAEKRWSLSLDLSAAPGLVSSNNAPFPKRRLSMDCLEGEEEVVERKRDDPPSPVLRSRASGRAPTPKTSRRKTHKKSKMAE